MTSLVALLSCGSVAWADTGWVEGWPTGLLEAGQPPDPVPVLMPPGPTARLVWDHDGQGVTQYAIKVDGEFVSAFVPQTFGNRTYETAFPLLTVGDHALTVCAVWMAAGTREEACSDPFAVRAIARPVLTKPTSLRVR